MHYRKNSAEIRSCIIRMIFFVVAYGILEPCNQILSPSGNWMHPKFLFDGSNIHFYTERTYVRLSFYKTSIEIIKSLWHLNYGYDI